jgi:hypothetical protein
MIVAKIKICKACQVEFAPRKPLQVACTLPCAITLSRDRRARAEAKAFKNETRRRKAALKNRAQWQKEAQIEFNKYIRARDAAANLPCISCGLYDAEPIGGQLWDCGHYLGTGAYPELRFNPFNAHRQHSRCNRGAAKSGRNEKSVRELYRANLITRIGLELVGWLESPHDPLKPTIDDLKYLKKYYSDMARDIIRGNGSF